MTVRFPYAPLRSCAARRVPSENVPGLRPDSPRSVSRVLGVPEHRIRRQWARVGLTLEEADHAAIMVGTHPSLIWPREWAESERDALGLDLPEPAPLPRAKPCACCSCTICHEVDALAQGGCSPWCFPCSFGVCACTDDDQT